MSKICIYNLKGDASGEKEVADGKLELKRGAQAVLDVVTAYRAGLRAGTASTKKRSDVSGGGSKPFKQKGIFDQETSMSLRRNVLEKGGSEEPMTLYRAFRGKDPSPKALLKRKGML